jgi:hypothetical protein
VAVAWAVAHLSTHGHAICYMVCTYTGYCGSLCSEGSRIRECVECASGRTRDGRAAARCRVWGRAVGVRCDPVSLQVSRDGPEVRDGRESQCDRGAAWRGIEYRRLELMFLFIDPYRFFLRSSMHCHW